jgi:hypothetical protein
MRFLVCINPRIQNVPQQDISEYGIRFHWKNLRYFKTSASGLTRVSDIIAKLIVRKSPQMMPVGGRCLSKTE